MTASAPAGTATKCDDHERTHDPLPLCGQGRLREQTHARRDERDGVVVETPGLRYSLCDHCGETITTPEQSRHNKRALIEARGRGVARHGASGFRILH